MELCTKSKPTKSAQAYRRLRELIGAGEFSSGDRLSESKAARLLGMGRAPVRNSLLRLEAEGLLASAGKRRSRVILFVQGGDWVQLLDRYEVREQIESAAARLAAKNMDGWKIDALRQHADRITQAKLANDDAARHQASEEFHRYLVHNSGNPLLAEIWDRCHLAPVRPVPAEFDHRILAWLAEAERAMPSLSAIVEAIGAHDHDRAEQLMRQRLRAGTERLRAFTQSDAGADEASSMTLPADPAQGSPERAGTLQMSLCKGKDREL